MNRAADQPEPNPLREGLSARAVPQPCTIVIFGATGDLTHRKLVPALYNLAADGDLPPAVEIVGFARRPKNDDEFRRELEEATRNFSRQTVRDEIWKNLSGRISPQRESSIASFAIPLAKNRPTESITFWGRKQRRTSLCCALQTRSSRRSGTGTTSITSRLLQRKRSE